MCGSSVPCVYRFVWRCLLTRFSLTAQEQLGDEEYEAQGQAQGRVQDDDPDSTTDARPRP